MGFFFRRRIKIAPGFHLNIGSKRSSITIGGGGFGYRIPLSQTNKSKTRTSRSTSRVAEPEAANDLPRELAWTKFSLFTKLLVIGFVGLMFAVAIGVNLETSRNKVEPVAVRTFKNKSLSPIETSQPVVAPPIAPESLSAVPLIESRSDQIQLAESTTKDESHPVEQPSEEQTTADDSTPNTVEPRLKNEVHSLINQAKILARKGARSAAKKRLDKAALIAGDGPLKNEVDEALKSISD